MKSGEWTVRLSIPACNSYQWLCFHIGLWGTVVPPLRSSAETGRHLISCNKTGDQEKCCCNCNTAMTQINTILKINWRIWFQNMSQKGKGENFYFLTWCWPCERRWPCFAPFWWHNRRRTWRCAATSLWWWSSNIRSHPSHSKEQATGTYILIQQHCKRIKRKKLKAKGT